MLHPGAGKTKRAYVRAYARGTFDPQPGGIYDFCTGRAAQYPIAFLGGTGEDDTERGWQGTLVRGDRRGYDELLRSQGGSTVAPKALRRISQIYRLEREGHTEQRATSGQEARRRQAAVATTACLAATGAVTVPDGGITAKALDYSLKNWPALTHHLLDGEVGVDNNSLENPICP